MKSVVLPGHRKHTNDTKINCDSGEAYQGRVTGPSLKRLYFHPVGIPTSVIEPFSTSAMRLTTLRVFVGQVLMQIVLDEIPRSVTLDFVHCSRRLQCSRDDRGTK